MRPRFSEALEYIEEGEPSFGIPLPNRNASIYRSSHFYLDEYSQSTQPLAENPRPHTQLGAAIENDFESADDGYQGRPFPQLQRPSFLQPGSDRHGGRSLPERWLDPPQPPDPGQPPQLGSRASLLPAPVEWAKLRRTLASGMPQGRRTQWRNGCSRRSSAAQQMRNASSSRLGKRAQEIQRAAAQDIEQFVAEQAAAETADITPLLAETGAGAGEAAGVGALEVLGGAVGAVVAPEVAIPAAIGLAAGAGGALAAGVGRSEASTQTAPASGSRLAAIAGGAFEGARAGASAFPTARNLGRAGGAAVGGLGAARWAWALAQWAAHTKAQGAGDGSSSNDQAPDIRTLNNMQQGAPQQQISLRQPRAQPRVQQPMVSRMDAESDDAPMAQQQSQPRPQVRSRPIQRPFGLGGGSLPQTPLLSGSDASGRQRPQRQARPEPSFNELRREALIRDPELA